MGAGRPSRRPSTSSPGPAAVCSAGAGRLVAGAPRCSAAGRLPCRCARRARASAGHGGRRLRRRFRGRARHSRSRLAGVHCPGIPGGREPRPHCRGEFCFRASLDSNPRGWPAGLPQGKGAPAGGGRGPRCQPGQAARRPPCRPARARPARCSRSLRLQSLTPHCRLGRRNAPADPAPVAPAAATRRPEGHPSHLRCAPPAPRRRRLRRRTRRRPAHPTGSRTRS